MRHVTTTSGEDIVLRNGEIDWLPTTLSSNTYHLLLNSEDFCIDKKAKLKLRRENRIFKRLPI